MSKTIPILERTVRCPKCERKTMRKSQGAELFDIFGSEYGREYFCDHCHLYFGTHELMETWGYDVADLFDTESDKRIFRAGRRSTNKVLPFSIIFKNGAKWIFDAPIIVEEENTVFNKDEPIWWTNKERQDAYEMVDRMFLGIPEWEEGTTNEGIDIGIEGYPC